MRRPVTVALVAFAAGAAVAAAPVPATATPISACTATTGTIVAVDFSHWGGPVVRGCDTNNPKNGAYLLTDMGFTLAGDQHDGPAFICRIGNQAFDDGTQYPTPKDEACILTPPASAYWSYWLAPAGQNTWTYSQLGAYSEVPKPGEVELWIFGATTNTANNDVSSGRPTCTPASLRAGGSGGSCSPSGSGTGHRGSSSPPPARSSTSRAAPTRPGGRSTPPRSREPATSAPALSRSEAAALAGARAQASAQASEPADGSPGPTGPGSPGPATPAAGSSPPGQPAGTTGADPSGTPGVGAVVDAQPAARVRASAGSIVPLLVGAALVVALAGAAGYALWRRRQPSE